MSNPFFSAFSHSDLFGKFIFLLLFIISIVTWYLIIHKLRSQSRMRHQMAQINKEFTQYQQNPLSIQPEHQSETNPLWKIYDGLRQLSLKILEKNRLHSETATGHLSATDMEFVASQIDPLIVREVKSLERNLFLLNTIVTLAPFLGLLGTVWGSLVTLGALRDQHTLSGNSLVLEGLSMALATTVLGLLVAIPALVGYNYLKARIRDLTREMGDFSSQVASAIEIQYRRVESG